jgi:WD40 repeat protein
MVMARGTSNLMILEGWQDRITAHPGGSANQVEACRNVPVLEPRLLKVRDATTTAQFTPDGTSIITAGPEREVRIHDAATGEEQKSFAVHTRSVNEVAVSSDGYWIATASDDGSFQVSPLHADDLMTVGCARVNRKLTVEECREYLGSDDCPPSPCD